MSICVSSRVARAATLLSLTIVTTLVVGQGCPSCQPRTVGAAVGRIRVRNVGAMITLARGNDTCGFASSGVQQDPTIEGEAGGVGSVTYTVDDCEIDLGSELVEIATD